MGDRAIPNGKVTPDFHFADYMKFFGAGALAACATHGVSILSRFHPVSLSSAATPATHRDDLDKRETGYGN